MNSKMARKKAGDQAGIIVEMLQHGSAHLRTVIAELFTDILKEGTATPASWKKSFVTVLYKKGDPQLPDNLSQNSTLFVASLNCFFLRDSVPPHIT